MQPVKQATDRLFINEHQQPRVNKLAAPRPGETVHDEQHKPNTISYVKSPDAQTTAALDEVFSRANAYSDMDATAQRSISAYHQVAVSEKRDAISQLFGVDLYA